jgi:hypothetical protein
MRFLAGQSGGSEPVNINPNDCLGRREPVPVGKSGESFQDCSRRCAVELLMNDGVGEGLKRRQSAGL